MTANGELNANTVPTITIKTIHFSRICSLANQYGWTPYGDDNLSTAIDTIEQALSVRVEEFDRMVSELAAANAKLDAIATIQKKANVSLSDYDYYDAVSDIGDILRS